VIVGGRGATESIGVRVTNSPFLKYSLILNHPLGLSHSLKLSRKDVSIPDREEMTIDFARELREDEEGAAAAGLMESSGLNGRMNKQKDIHKMRICLNVWQKRGRSGKSVKSEVQNE
jgi:hypothetical protein